MTVDILMPALSPTMEVGTLAKWMVKKGDVIKPGDLLAEIETDKAIMEFEAVEEGEILELSVKEGKTDIPVNFVIAKIRTDSSHAQEDKTEPKKQNIANELEEKTTLEKVHHDDDKEQSQNHGLNKNRFFSTPLARRIAKEKNIDLSTIKGSGPRGRIVKADVENATKTSSTKNLLDDTTQFPRTIEDLDISKIYGDRQYKDIKIDGMRKTIISRLTSAKQTIPHYYLRRDIRVDSLITLRSQLNEGLKDKNIKISINDFIIKACASALQEVPECNVIWGGNRILSFTASDIAVAVAIDGGLITPVLYDLEKKGLIDICVEMKVLAEKARKKALKPHEYQGGSFSISSLGMMGIKNFDAVINPPHASILAIGAALKQPFIEENGRLSVQTIISVTLSADHRMIDGAIGAKFLERISYNLENPGILLV